MKRLEEITKSCENITCFIILHIKTKQTHDTQTIQEIRQKDNEKVVKTSHERKMASSSCPCSDQSCQKSVPVNLGTSYFYEKSPSFYKNPREFFKKHLNEERVFVCRFAMKPCFVLASNSLVKELLNSSKGDTYNGLYDFFFGLFGDNILFADDLQSKHVS